MQMCLSSAGIKDVRHHCLANFLSFFVRRFFLGDILLFAVPSDLTAEERQELENIRRRKQELLADIQVGECWEAGQCRNTWFVAVGVTRCP